MNLYDIVLREYSPARVNHRNFINSVISKWPVDVTDQLHFPATVNSMSIDSTESFLALADSNGAIHIRIIKDKDKGQTSSVQSRRFFNSCLIDCQWYPTDPGLICATGSREIQLISCETFSVCDNYKMDSLVKQIYSSDWSSLNTSLISVACSSSTVRIIDVRTGSSAQCLILDSLLGSKDHSATRVKWDPTDPEVIYAGDSSGYIHLFDIRSPRKALASTFHNSSIGQPVTELTCTPDGLTMVSIHGLWNKIHTWTLKEQTLKHLNVHFNVPCSKKGRKSKIPVSGLLKCESFINNGFIYSPAPEGNGDVYVNDINTGQLVAEFIANEFRPIAARKVNSIVGLRTPYPIIYSGGKIYFRSWAINCNQEDDEKSTNCKSNQFSIVKTTVDTDVHRDNWSDSD